MRSFLGLVALVMVGSVGCGTTVYVGNDDDGAGGQGEGGNGEGAQGPTTSSTSTGTIPPVNPPDCPAGAPDFYGECALEDLVCGYLEEAGCTVSYTCVVTEECYEGTTVSGTGGYDGGDDGGYGGYGGCYRTSYWVPTEATCAPAAVDCMDAVEGDVCALPGEYCGGEAGECEYEDKSCGTDHRWVVSSYYDECCGDDCCYDECCDGECECSPYYCPEQAPQQGEYCDPCWDSESCSYPFETECGTLYTYARCNPDIYSWELSGEDCTGTTSSSSVATASSSTGSGPTSSSSSTSGPGSSSSSGGGGFDGVGGGGL